MKKLFVLINVICFCLAVKAQNAIPATGGNASGTGGSSSYTVGQVAWTLISGSTGSAAQGVQQPYEISMITAVKAIEGPDPECKVYPNPTGGLIKLVIGQYEKGNWRFSLYNVNSILLLDRKIENEETEISFENLPASVYFLKVLLNNQEIKVIKIVKK